MTKVNFDEVNEPEVKAGTTFKVVEKGAQKLTIEEITEAQSQSGKDYYEVKFQSERFGASFTHKFFLTTAALPRLQDLFMAFTGAKATGNLGLEEITAKLVGKSAWVIVDAEAREKESNGKVYVNEYPTLRFSRFAQPLDTPEESRFKDSDARVKNNTTQTNTDLPTPPVDNDPLPF